MAIQNADRLQRRADRLASRIRQLEQAALLQVKQGDETAARSTLLAKARVTTAFDKAQRLAAANLELAQKIRNALHPESSSPPPLKKSEYDLEQAFRQLEADELQQKRSMLERAFKDEWS